MEAKTIQAGQWIITEGGLPAYFLYKLLSGKVSVYQNGSKVNTIEIQKGEKPLILGIIAAVKHDRIHMASVRTETDIEVQTVPIDNIWGALRNEIPKTFQSELDTMITAIRLNNEIKIHKDALGNLPRVNPQIPDTISDEVEEVLKELKSLYEQSVG